MKKRITTVRGDISPDDLGLTSMHEHTLMDLTLLLASKIGMKAMLPPEKLEFKPENFSFLKQGLWSFSEGNSPLDDEHLTAELNIFKKVGGKSIVDGSPIGLRGNPINIKTVSEATGVNIVCATGLYAADSRPQEFIGKSEKDLIFRFDKEINEGIDGSDVKPGFLKCAINTLDKDGRINKDELNTLRACAKIAVETGMSLQLHSAHPINLDHIFKAVNIIVDQCRLKPERLVLLHMDTYLTDPKGIVEYLSDLNATRNISANTFSLLKFLDKGINISFDNWANPMDTPSYMTIDDYDRLKALVFLIKKGYSSQIVLGHDVYGKFFGVTYGNYGYTRIVEFVPKMLAMLGLKDEADKMLVQNPARILAY